MTHDEFDAAYQENLPYLIRLAERILRKQDRAVCEDVVADAMCRCLINLGDFTVIGKASVRTWMTNAVVWECKDNIRRYKMTFMQETLDDVEQVAEENRLPEYVTADIDAALDDLPRLQRQVIQLLYIEGFTYKEVAEQFNVTISAIQRAEQDGLSQLRRTLESYHG